ncbi:MAG TPA: Stp1/IreP family PP2C-type Ser/Thr phosphatase [Candidatus Dormibacteraeota bacterium]|nr:Stp1/IreP family PP2C-type Ser/Thr phosphatase [Candidatus Dormibacteraeota bacterium]
MEAYFLTDQGQVRGHNEDSGGIYYNSSGQLLAVIADGMGGHQAGDIASEMAVSIIQQSWKESKELKDPEETETWLSHILFYVNNEIYRLATEKEEYAGMGTTIVVVINCGDFITVAHIGDSRCYLQNANGFNQITEDHSLVNELVRTGQISREDAEQHPRKNIVLRALGTEVNVEADIRSLSWEYGDKLLLCSDGLTDKISNEKILEFINAEEQLKQISQNLIDLANDRGGEDNISLIIIQHTPPKKVGEETC